MPSHLLRLGNSARRAPLIPQGVSPAKSLLALRSPSPLAELPTARQRLPEAAEIQPAPPEARQAARVSACFGRAKACSGLSSLSQLLRRAARASTGQGLFRPGVWHPFSAGPDEKGSRSREEDNLHREDALSSPCGLLRLVASCCGLLRLVAAYCGLLHPLGETPRGCPLISCRIVYRAGYIAIPKDAISRNKPQ